MTGILSAFVATWVVVLLLLGYAATNEDNRFNAWTQQCHKDGGAVQTESQSFWSTDYECYKDGKIIDHVN